MSRAPGGVGKFVCFAFVFVVGGVNIDRSLTQELYRHPPLILTGRDRSLTDFRKHQREKREVDEGKERTLGKESRGGKLFW